MNRHVSNRLVAAMAAAALAVSLSACGDDAPTVTGTLPTATPSATASATASASPTASAEPVGDTACVTGSWQLDVPDYSSQAAVYIKGVGIPVDSFAMTGSQSLTLTADGVMTVGTDLTTAAVVAGNPIRWSDQSAGNGEWAWNDDGTLGVDGFAYTVDPVVPPGGAPIVPGTDWSAPVSVVCSGDRMELRGSTAPLTGRFVRR